MKKWIVVLILVFAVGGVAVYFYTFKKPARTAASEEAVFAVSAKDLATEFESDENAANTKYLNKVIKVHGTVVSISESETETSVTLKEVDSSAGVTCSFEKESFDKSKLKPGQKVFIKGICSGFLMDVVLNKCALTTEAAI
jgi:hypothetical protein